MNLKKLIFVSTWPQHGPIWAPQMVPSWDQNAAKIGPDGLWGSMGRPWTPMGPLRTDFGSILGRFWTDFAPILDRFFILILVGSSSTAGFFLCPAHLVVVCRGTAARLSPSHLMLFTAARPDPCLIDSFIEGLTDSFIVLATNHVKLTLFKPRGRRQRR